MPKQPQGGGLRKPDWHGAVAHCAPEPPAAIRAIADAAARSDDPHRYVKDMLAQSRRAA